MYQRAASVSSLLAGKLTECWQGLVRGVTAPGTPAQGWGSLLLRGFAAFCWDGVLQVDLEDYLLVGSGETDVELMPEVWTMVEHGDNYAFDKFLYRGKAIKYPFTAEGRLDI